MTHDYPSNDRISSPVDVEEAEAVEAVVRNYIDGWHSGDAQRMDSSLHDDLYPAERYDASAIWKAHCPSPGSWTGLGSWPPRSSISAWRGR